MINEGGMPRRIVGGGNVWGILAGESGEIFIQRGNGLDP